MPGTQESEPQSLRLTQLEAHNFKCLEALDITPGNKTLIIFKGPNEAGKTTAIEAFMAAIGGKGSRPEVPITKGKEEGHVTATLGGENGNQYEVTCQFRKGKTDTLTVKDISGERPRSLRAGQTVLDGLFSDLSFNPLAFAEANDKARVPMLVSATGLQEDYDKAQAFRATLYDDRTEVNREIKRLGALVESTPDPAPDDVLERVSDEAVAEEMQKAQKQNEGRASWERSIKEEKGRIEQSHSDIVKLERKLSDANDSLDKQRDNFVRLQNELEAMPPEIDVGDLQERISEANKHNDRCDKQEQNGRHLKDLREQEKAALSLSDEIEELDGSLIEKLNATSLFKNVPGLEIRDGGVWHNDLPLSQASGMRRLDISCLVGMAANKQLRVMLVDEGDKLDDNSLTRLCDLADQHGYQILMTAVRLGDPSDPDTYVCELREGAMV